MSSQTVFCDKLKLTGTEEKHLLRVLEKLFNLTEQLYIEPERLCFCSIYQNFKDEVRVAKMDAETATFSNLVHQIMKKNDSDRAAMDFFKIPKSYFYQRGVSREEMYKLLKIGMYFEYDDLLILPSERSLGYLGRFMKFSSFQKGMNPLRELLIASQIYDSKPFYMTVRKGKSVMKAFYASATKPDIEPVKNVCRSVIKNLKKKGAVIRSWEVTQEKTEVLFTYPQYSVEGFEFGVKFHASDIGEYAFTLCNCIYAAGNAYMINDCSIERKNYGQFNTQEFFNEFDSISTGTFEEYLFNIQFSKPADKLALFTIIKDMKLKEICGKKLSYYVEEKFRDAAEENSDIYHGYEPIMRLPNMARELGAKDYVIRDLNEAIEKTIAVLISNKG